MSSSQSLRKNRENGVPATSPVHTLPEGYPHTGRLWKKSPSACSSFQIQADGTTASFCRSWNDSSCRCRARESCQLSFLHPRDHHGITTDNLSCLMNLFVQLWLFHFTWHRQLQWLFNVISLLLYNGIIFNNIQRSISSIHIYKFYTLFFNMYISIYCQHAIDVLTIMFHIAYSRQINHNANINNYSFLYK